MRYFLKSLFLNVVSLFKPNKRISVAELDVYFDLLASQFNEPRDDFKGE